ncbi:carboxylating nicotinate-nucleotide diphosphorylase [Euhalothece natronophila Z-M001]|uniref:Probable nicotinate-nucleotide pyrophosphorylase [carboxylating] n=2 Tax=Euhalothece TaxID=65097 RepID=A0A5B8NIL8_9CHRO|nr:carboxylating nicotinate-nucleotide diphosphorylase [Euhalothece natronophila Z-M001]
MVMLPPNVVLEPLFREWLREDIGRGDRATGAITANNNPVQEAVWMTKQAGVIAGLPFAEKIFSLLGKIDWQPQVTEGSFCENQVKLLRCRAGTDTLLTGERVALNLVMHLSGIATLTHHYAEKIADLPTQLVDTRKTTPGLRLLEKYATQVGGAMNHRFGLDDAAMIKENHIQAAGGITSAIAQLRSNLPYPLTIEVETTNATEVEEAIASNVDIIMLDNMALPLIREMVDLIKKKNSAIKVEASGNINLNTIREIAETGVDYISTSAPITQASWLDLSMTLV